MFYVSITNQNGTVVTNSTAYSYGSSLNFTNDPALFSSELTPISVPTMNEWGMMLFIFIAGTGSMYYLRKSSRISHL